eukprot:2466296-Heterocapsa_arctica.AAC.1
MCNRCGEEGGSCQANKCRKPINALPMPEAGIIWPDEAPAESAIPAEPVLAIAAPLLPELADPALNTGTADAL